MEDLTSPALHTESLASITLLSSLPLFQALYYRISCEKSRKKWWHLHSAMILSLAVKTQEKSCHKGRLCAERVASEKSAVIYC
jgi:hypothetical protein